VASKKPTIVIDDSPICTTSLEEVEIYNQHKFSTTLYNLVYTAFDCLSWLNFAAVIYSQTRTKKQGTRNYWSCWEWI